MTNVSLLKAKIAESGYKLQFVAETIGLTRQALHKRLVNGSDFTASEIMALTKLLKLSAAEQKAIFFCTDGSQNVNKGANNEA